jgi:VWFA-related protein
MRATLVVAVLFLIAVPLAAQVRERVDVQILEIDATVIDRNGKVIEGLTRDDFEVFIGKRATPVTNFFAVEGGKILSGDDVTTSTKVAKLPIQTSFPTSLVIFIDEMHLSQHSHTRTIDALKRYVAANVGSNTTAMLVRYNGDLSVLVRPTERPGYILGALDKLAVSPSADSDRRERRAMIDRIEEVFFPQSKHEDETDIGFRELEDYAQRRVAEVDRTIDALQQAVNLTSIFTGRKVLLYVSDGLPQQPAIEMFDFWDRTARLSLHGQTPGFEVQHLNSGQAARFDRTEKFRQMIDAAQHAGVAIYSFDAGGVRGYEGTSVESATTHARLDTMLFQSNQRGGLQYAADETGGKYIANENNVDKLLGEISAQFTTFYSIGVSAAAGDIRVRVKNHPEYRVLTARRRPPRTRDEELEQDVRRRLYTRGGDNPIDAKVNIGRPADIAGQCVMPLRIDVPQPKLAPELTPQAVDVRIVLLNDRNDESALQRVSMPFVSGQVAQSMQLRVRPVHHVLSLAITNPVSGESSFFQAEVDGTACNDSVAINSR